jgi:hypothetical protein
MSAEGLNCFVSQSGAISSGTDDVAFAASRARWTLAANASSAPASIARSRACAFVGITGGVKEWLWNAARTCGSTSTGLTG